MANIEEQVITHEQVRKGVTLDNDPYQIGAKCLESGRVKTYLSNPNLDDESEPLIVYEKVDGDIMGRAMFFPTKTRIGVDYIRSYAGSSLLVHEKARKHMLGASLVLFPIYNKKNTILLYGGMTKMAVDLYKKLKFTIFDIPSVWQIRNIRPILQRLHLRGFLLNCISVLGNLVLKPYQLLIKIPIHFLCRGYDTVKLQEAPDWIEKIIESDNHKYAEYHNKEWFNWIIHNNYYGKENDKQDLYGIYKNKTPIGFVLLTEREWRVESERPYTINFGTVREWGTVDSSLLNEYTIYKLALSLFSKNVDVVQISTTENLTRKRLRKYGFIHRGNYNIAFRPIGMHLDDDSKNISNWRIRSSYSDTCFY